LGDAPRIHFDKTSSTTSFDKIPKLVLLYEFLNYSKISQKMLNYELYWHYHVCSINAVARTQTDSIYCFVYS